MDLHGKTMNIQVDDGLMDETLKSYGMLSKETQLAYKLGHRDARYAAAELALTHNQVLTAYENPTKSKEIG